MIKWLYSNKKVLIMIVNDDILDIMMLHVKNIFWYAKENNLKLKLLCEPELIGLDKNLEIFTGKSFVMFSVDPDNIDEMTEETNSLSLDIEIDESNKEKTMAISFEFEKIHQIIIDDEVFFINPIAKDKKNYAEIDYSDEPKDGECQIDKEIVDGIEKSINLFMENEKNLKYVGD
jgi:hypothetical protein